MSRTPHGVGDLGRTVRRVVHGERWERRTTVTLGALNVLSPFVREVKLSSGDCEGAMLHVRGTYIPGTQVA